MHEMFYSCCRSQYMSNVMLLLSTNIALVHYNDVIMSAMASQITGVSVVCSTVCSDANPRKHQISASLALVRGIHRWPVNSPHKGPVTRKMFPSDNVIMGENLHETWKVSASVKASCIIPVQFLLIEPILVSSLVALNIFNEKKGKFRIIQATIIPFVYFRCISLCCYCLQNKNYIK